MSCEKCDAIPLFKIPLFQQSLDYPILLTSRKLHSGLLKQLYNLYPYFLKKEKLLTSSNKNANVNKTQGACHMIYIFLDLLQISYDWTKFHYYTICVTDFRNERLFAPQSNEQPQNGPSGIRVNCELGSFTFKVLYRVGFILVFFKAK